MHSSLHLNCHHQITYAKFNEKVNVDHIRRSIDEFSWERCFANISVNNKVHMFNKTIKNIMSNYIPHETIICDDRDSPWINKDIKQLILDKNHAYKSYIRNNKSLNFFKQYLSLQTKLNSLIQESKNQYCTRLFQKELDPNTSQDHTGQYYKPF